MASMAVNTVVMCIGNQMGGDDAVGPYVFRLLNQQKNPDVIPFDCGTAPENFTSKIRDIHPEQVILVDAVDMGLEAGAVRIIPSERIAKMHVSTHSIPLNVLMTYLKQYAPVVKLIGIQPASFTGELSEAVKEAADKLINDIKNNQIQDMEVLA